MRTAIRLVLCFVVLPLVPTVAFVLSPSEDVPVVRDVIAVFVLAAVVAAVISGALGFRVRRNALTAVLYALTTGALSIVPIVVFIAILFEIHCGNGDTSGAC